MITLNDIKDAQKRLDGRVCTKYTSYREPPILSTELNAEIFFEEDTTTNWKL